MEAFRLVKEPKNGILTIHLPDGLRAKKKLEVIVLPFEEVTQEQVPYDLAQFQGIWKDLPIDTEKVCQEMRGSWTRSI